MLPKITDVTPLSAVGGSATVITVSGFNLKVVGDDAGVKIGTFSGAAGLDHVQRDAAHVPGAAGGGDGQDHGHDGRRIGHRARRR